MAEVKTQIEELNLDQQITIKNLAGWSVAFKRLLSVGDITIPPNGSIRLSRNEVIAQVQSGNRLFTGKDGQGGHATVYIDDAPTRIVVNFDSEDGKDKQTIFSDADVKKIFDLKTQSIFEKRLVEYIQTRAEKYALMQSIKRQGLNDYSKIRFAEQYTGYNLQ